MKRKFIILLLIFFSFLIETSVFTKMTFLSATPDLLLIMTVSIGFMQDSKEGLLTGFLCGLLLDLTYNDLLGFHALIYMYIGYFAGRFNKVFFDNDIRVPLVLVGISDLVCNLLVYIIRILLDGNTNIGYAFIHIMLPELAATLLLTLISYKLIYLINHSMVEKEKEGRQSLWIRN